MLHKGELQTLTKLCMRHQVHKVYVPIVGMENSTHVLQQQGDIYNAVLGMVDIVKGTNSYYKLQILESDRAAR